MKLNNRFFMVSSFKRQFSLHRFLKCARSVGAENKKTKNKNKRHDDDDDDE